MEPAMTPRLGSVTPILMYPLPAISGYLTAPCITPSWGMVSLFKPGPPPHLTHYHTIFDYSHHFLSDHCSLAQMDPLLHPFEACPRVAWKS